MKIKNINFVKKSFYFVAGFFVLIFFLDQIIKFSVKQINVGEFGVFNRINEGTINADIIISGSSRALKAINPEVVTNETGLTSYNIGADGSDLGIQLPKLKWYLNTNNKPQILIQDISQFGGGISSTIFEPYKYLPYLSDDSLYQGILRIDKDFWIHKYFAPANLIFYNFDFYSKIFLELYQTLKKNDKYINGFLPDNSKWKRDFNLYKKKKPQGINCSVTNNYIRYIYELKNLCKERNIKLVFVVLPNYYRLKEIAKNLNDVNNFYKSLSEKSKVYYFDFTNSEIAKNEKYLYNFTHLNLTGANYFSKVLADTLLKIK